MKRRDIFPSLFSLAIPLGGLTIPGSGIANEKGMKLEKLSLMVKAKGLSKPHYLPITLAKALGYFESEGLDVSLINEDDDNGDNADRDLNQGKVHAVAGFYDKLLVNLARPSPDFVNVLTMGETPGYVLLVSRRLKGKVHSLAELKGRTIAVTGLGKITHTLVNQLVISGGNSITDYKPLPVGGKVLEALADGSADFGLYWGPEAVRAIDLGHGSIFADLISKESTRTIFGGSFASTCVYMKSSFINANPAVTQKMVNALVKTLQWIQKNSPQAMLEKLPTSYSEGNSDLYLKAIKLAYPEFSVNGILPPGTPENMIKVLGNSKPELKALAGMAPKTFTNKFVNSVGTR